MLILILIVGKYDIHKNMQNLYTKYSYIDLSLCIVYIKTKKRKPLIYQNFPVSLASRRILTGSLMNSRQHLSTNMALTYAKDILIRYGYGLNIKSSDFIGTMFKLNVPS